MNIAGLMRGKTSGAPSGPASVADAVRQAVMQHADQTDALGNHLSTLDPSDSSSLSETAPVLDAHGAAAASLGSVLSSIAPNAKSLSGDGGTGGLLAKYASALNAHNDDANALQSLMKQQGITTTPTAVTSSGPEYERPLDIVDGKVQPPTGGTSTIGGTDGGDPDLLHAMQTHSDLLRSLGGALGGENDALHPSNAPFLSDALTAKGDAAGKFGGLMNQVAQAFGGVTPSNGNVGIIQGKPGGAPQDLNTPGGIGGVLGSSTGGIGNLLASIAKPGESAFGTIQPSQGSSSSIGPVGGSNALDSAHSDYMQAADKARDAIDLAGGSDGPPRPLRRPQLEEE